MAFDVTKNVLDLMNYAGGFIDQVPYFPFLHAIHCYATSASLRSEQGALQFAHQHPLASLAGNLLIVNAGGILIAAALGLPLIGPFGSVANTFTAVLFWWLVYFGPGDLFFKLYKWKPFQILLMTARETRRCKKILDAVKTAAVVAEGQWFSLILVGALGGCSGKLMQTTEASMRKGSTDVSKSEFLQISFVTKASLIISTVYVLANTHVIPLTLHQAMFACSTLLVAANFSMAVAGMPDPFHPVSRIAWTVVSMASRAPPGEGEEKKNS